MKIIPKGKTRNGDVVLVLSRLTKFLGFSPGYDGVAKQFIPSNAYRCWGLLILSSLLIAHAASTPRKLDLYSKMKTSTMIVDVLSTATVTLISITSVLSVNVWNYARYLTLLNNFLYVDEVLDRYGQGKRRGKLSFYGEIIVFHAIFLIVAGYKLDTWWYKDLKKVYTVEIFQRYHACVLIIIMRNLLVSLRHRYEAVNNFIVETMRNYGGGEPLLLKKLATARKLYTITSEVVDLFNKIFGFAIFFLTMNTVVTFLVFFNEMLHRDQRESKSQNNLDVVMCVWIIGTLITTVMLISSCDSCTKEAQRTAEICYKQIQGLTKSNRKETTTAEELELRQLSAQVLILRPHFSAAGFFDVDYTTLYTLVEALTSYVVVLIQFSK